MVSHGVRIGIRVNDPEVLERLVDRLPPASKPAATPVVDELFSLRTARNTPGAAVRRFSLLYWGAGRVVRSLDPTEAIEALESFLNLVVAVRARRRLFVRAGVVGWQDRAIVLPGRPGNGKSTLVAALVRAGATYYSDLYAVLDPAGRVHPYPKPLTLPAAEGDRTRKCPAAALPGPWGSRPLPLGLVAFTTFRPGATWRPRVVSPGQAVLRLLADTVQTRLRPETTLAILQRAVRGAVALGGRRGEADAMARTLLERVPADTAGPLAGLTNGRGSGV